MIGSLSEKAMLVDLKISVWTARRFDKTATSDVHTKNNAADDAGRYNKLLVPKSALSGITKRVTAIRTFHYKHTMPWDDRGYRILASAMYFEYTASIQALIEDFNRAVDEFCINYPSYIDGAQLVLGRLWKEEDYPHVSDIRGKFGVKVDINPMPNGEDFRVNLSDEAALAIKKDIEARKQEYVEKAMSDLWNRLHDVVQKMAVTLKDPDREFKKSLLGNIRDLVKILPDMNIAGDPQLEDMTREIESTLLDVEPTDLRVDLKTRAEKADMAQKVLDKMAGYTGMEVSA